MESKILSIIIPTYNGGDYLALNLKVLIPILKKIDNNLIEFIVANNASEDNTEEIILEAKKNYPLLKYIKREKNIGDVANFSESIKECSGKYILLLGDDDVLFPSSIEFILSLIQTKSGISLIHWNRIDYIERTNVCSLFNKNVDINGISYYNSLLLFLKEHATMDSMSTVIFSRDSWDRGAKYVKECYYGYQWYARILFGAVNGEYVYSFQPLVIQRHPAQRKWVKKQALYTSGLLSIYKDLDEIIPGVYEWIKTHYIMLTTENYLNEMLIVAKNKSWYKSYYNELKIHYNKKQKFLAFTVLFLMPSFISKIIILTMKVFVFLNRRLRK